MNPADSNTLQQFAAAATHQFSAFANDHDDPGSLQDATGAGTAGYAPVDTLGVDHTQSHPMNLSSGSPNVQTRRMRNTSNTVTMRSPQQTRPVQTQQNHTPSRNGSLSTSQSTPQMQVSPQTEHVQNQHDPTSAQNKGAFIFRNASSAYPNGTPQLASPQSARSQLYASPQGTGQPDPWSSHFKPSPSIEAANGAVNGHNDIADADSAVAANPFSDTFPLVPHPPQLEQWRKQLFNVTDTLILSEAEFLTYFPHVDNVYSHRSTQKYKRKAFVSHYWDCRLKGRPSGTPKSDDPNKKKRKRTARERDLCDVKIKVTEYFSSEQAKEMGLDGNGADTMGELNGGMYGGADTSGLTIVMEDGSHSLGSGMNGLGGGLVGAAPVPNTNSADPNFGLLELPRPLPQGHPGADGKRWFTIQRVRGNPGGGAVKDNNRRGSNVNGEVEDDIDQSVLDPSLGCDLDHKHTLEESDRIKKNSVQRWLVKEEKEKKRLSVSNPLSVAQKHLSSLTRLTESSDNGIVRPNQCRERIDFANLSSIRNGLLHGAISCGACVHQNDILCQQLLSFCAAYLDGLGNQRYSVSNGGDHARQCRQLSTTGNAGSQPGSSHPVHPTW